MKFKQLLFLLFTGIIVYTNPLSAHTNVMFTPPKGWKIADANELSPNVKILVVGKGLHHFPPSLNLATENYPESLESYLKIVEAINASKNAEWKSLGTIETKAGVAHLSQVEAKEQWGDICYLHAILKKEEVIYILTACAKKEEFPRFYPEFFASFQSLEITLD